MRWQNVARDAHVGELADLLEDLIDALNLKDKIMEDVFYMSHSEIKPKDLYDLFVASFPNYRVTPTIDDSSANDQPTFVEIEDTYILFKPITDVNKQLALTEGANKVYKTYEPKSLMIISFRTRLKLVLIDLLKCCLKEYRGHVGCDDDWEVLYDVDTISQLHCGSGRN